MTGSSSSQRKRRAKQGSSEYYVIPQKRQNITDTDTTSQRDLERKIATDVNIGRFAESRAIEIQALTKAVKDVGGNHLAFQKLPRHMRRRAMSHNIKRVPRRLHDQVKSELEKVKAPNKRPSRRYRRKPSNLLSEYERRKRRISWLETHIWHAKRFKMVEKWGYRLPLHPNEKSIRACYRAVRRHCLLQDVSYESYIEIKGDRESIIKGLEHLTSAETGLTFAARMTSKGTRQGSLVLYCYDCYPHQALGYVTYLWRPQKDATGEDSRGSTLWVCCQPAFYSDAFREINKCFQPSVTDNSTSSGKLLLLKNLEKETQFAETENAVQVTSLKDHLVKFRLYGPLSTLVLRETVKLWNVGDCCQEIKESGTSKSSDDSGNQSSGDISFWWKDYYREEQKRMINKRQKEAWEATMTCQSPSETPPHCVISAVARDPRLLLPPQRNKVFPDEKDSAYIKLDKDLFNESEVSDSPLWEESIRLNVKLTKVLEKELNAMKSKHLIPGTPLEMGEKESRIPVLLIQRPGFSHLHSPSASSFQSSSPVQEGFASGWDIVLPSGWAMAFWVALVYRGARVGGLREAHSISLQARQLNQIGDTPDSVAGKLEILAEREARQLKHDRRPPAKRPNYTKLGFHSPFSFCFDELCKEWMVTVSILIDKHNNGFLLRDSSADTDIYVLRHRKMLQLLNHALTDMKSFMPSSSSSIKSVPCNKPQKKTETNPLTKLLSEEKGRTLIDDNRKALVPVCVNILCRGIPAPHAQICQPSREDLRMVAKDKHYGGPVEALHPDLDIPRRKEEKKERLRLRRKQKQGKRKRKGKETETVTSGVVPSEMSQSDALANQPTTKPDETAEGGCLDKEDSNLHHSMRNCTSRPVIGFVTKGDFNLGQGQGSGIGFCSVAALLHVIADQGRQKHCVVLVRNPTSTQYRFATISLVL